MSLDDLQEQRPAGLRRIHFELKLTVAIEVQVYPQQPGRRQQEHCSLQRAQTGRGRPEAMPPAHRQPKTQQREGYHLPGVLVVAEENQVQQHACKPEHDHSEQQSAQSAVHGALVFHRGQRRLCMSGVALPGVQSAVNIARHSCI